MDSEIVLLKERQRAIHLLRSGHPPADVAKLIGRSERWVRKWCARFKSEGWEGLHSRSRRPHHLAKAYSEAMRQAVLQTRSELEAEAARSEAGGLKFVGSPAIRTRLKERGIEKIPSARTIERYLHDAGMTHPRRKQPEDTTHYPRLQATSPHYWVQVDIYPRYLKGGQSVACFNAIDVYARQPFSYAYTQRRSADAADFLWRLWQARGVPRYTQVDNESCFSGGFTHPGVLGRVVRLALLAGTELVFSPIRYPKAQGHIERFHQDYGKHVWEDSLLESLEEVNQRSERFITAYSRRPHPKLQEQTPESIARSAPVRPLPAHTPAREAIPDQRLPLFAGRVHFIRRVNEQGNIRLLNLSWQVPQAAAGQGVWATLSLTPDGAHLDIYDAAPDAGQRRLLVRHPFPLKEDVLPSPAPPQQHTFQFPLRRWMKRLLLPLAALLGTMS
jgi:transposase